MGKRHQRDKTPEIERDPSTVRQSLLKAARQFRRESAAITRLPLTKAPTNAILSVAAAKAITAATLFRSIRAEGHRSRRKGTYRQHRDGRFSRQRYRNRQDKIFENVGRLSKVDFREASFGLVGTDGTIYTTDNKNEAGTYFYYLAEGQERWKTYRNGGDGCLGGPGVQASRAFKGFMAFA